MERRKLFIRGNATASDPEREEEESGNAADRRAASTS